ncbi:hypothetical protein TPACW82_0126d [Treponema pallidum subsp. pallidum]|uniref:Major outer sheath protein C-terminal domain-containing protein n=1 Tax=Treponema pallidum subsp. pallidum str. Mexico A TaxID=686990 RepID=E5FP17_TREPL|nr:major outer sheath C-terminal domain-containing protein [Treponema pallidum]ADR64418.1 hypothetical protein [Treponema pallidum subsp. pallidum str. Mexico A]QCP96419.1 hypothetical protein TPACW82_0126d [Treponema pallidum subsp. pallidum]
MVAPETSSMESRAQKTQFHPDGEGKSNTGAARAGRNHSAAFARYAPATKWKAGYCGYYECGVVVSPLEKVEIRLSWEQGKLQENSNVVIEKNVTERWQFVGACRLIW